MGTHRRSGLLISKFASKSFLDITVRGWLEKILFLRNHDFWVLPLLFYLNINLKLVLSMVI